MKKKIKRWTLLIVIGLFILWVVYRVICLLGNGFMPGCIPERRTFYLTYASFNRDAKYCEFIENLPKSAQGTKYFHEIYFFTFRNGYGTVISEKDYEEAKRQCLKEKEERVNYFISHIYFMGEQIEQSEEEIEERRRELNIYSINDSEELEPSVADILEENGVDFFDKIARQNVREGAYHFLWYEIIEDDGYQTEFTGSIYNDETFELIEVCYRTLHVYRQ